MLPSSAQLVVVALKNMKRVRALGQSIPCLTSSLSHGIRLDGVKGVYLHIDMGLDRFGVEA